MTKENIINHLKTLLDARMKVAWDAMQAAQASANEEGKSSAGDKYETSRAMGQIERDMHARQFENIRQERNILERISPNSTFVQAGLGALVTTTLGEFFISVSLGIVELEGQKIMAISQQSPIGVLLMGKKVGQSFHFQNKEVLIKALG